MDNSPAVSLLSLPLSQIDWIVYPTILVHGLINNTIGFYLKVQHYTADQSCLINLHFTMATTLTRIFVVLGEVEISVVCRNLYAFVP